MATILAPDRKNHPRAKIGTEDSNAALKEMGKAYNLLSRAELDELQAEAAKVNAAREELMQCPFSNKSGQYEAHDSNLRKSQVDRLNQRRLDVTLRKMTDHSIWSQGLGLGDHICALKPCFIAERLDTESESNVTDFFQEHMKYDSNIIKNDETLPGFSKSCLWTNGGICERDRHYKMVKDMVWQLHSILAQQKIGAHPFILCLKPTSDSSDGMIDALWMVVGSATARPITFTGIRLFKVLDLRFGFQTDENRPVTGSVHVAVKELLQKHVAAGVSVIDISLQVGWVFVEMGSAIGVS